VTRVVPNEGSAAMAHVSVTINGRQYRMACDDGQENHLARLAYDLDQRIARLRADFGEIGDMRLTVMAALIVSDELAEMAQRMRRLEAELMALQEARKNSVDRTQATEAAVVAAFDAASARIEKVVRTLNQPPAGGDVPPG
jgi:cell division protein ZapA